MNDISIVSHLKNEIEFLQQFWNHIHSYNPREIVIVDTGSVDGTYEWLLVAEKHPSIIYKIKQSPRYTGMIFCFNQVIEMATSKWVIKLDADELLSERTQDIILDAIDMDGYNCVSMPTIHHFINSDLYFDCLKTHPDYHQRIFKKEVFGTNSESGSRNHGSLVWAKPLTIMTLGIDNPLYHYSFLRSFEKIQKRAIINYFIDIKKIEYESVFIDLENNPEKYIELFTKNNPKLTPVWQTEPTLIDFNDMEDYYISQFLKFGKKVDFHKPEDLIVNRICDWPKAEKILKDIL